MACSLHGECFGTVYASGKLARCLLGGCCEGWHVKCVVDGVLCMGEGSVSLTWGWVVWKLLLYGFHVVLQAR